MEHELTHMSTRHIVSRYLRNIRSAVLSCVFYFVEMRCLLTQLCSYVNLHRLIENGLKGEDGDEYAVGLGLASPVWWKRMPDTPLNIPPEPPAEYRMIPGSWFA